MNLSRVKLRSELLKLTKPHFIRAFFSLGFGRIFGFIFLLTTAKEVGPANWLVLLPVIAVSSFSKVVIESTIRDLHIRNRISLTEAYIVIVPFILVGAFVADHLLSPFQLFICVCLLILAPIRAVAEAKADSVLRIHILNYSELSVSAAFILFALIYELTIELAALWYLSMMVASSIILVVFSTTDAARYQYTSSVRFDYIIVNVLNYISEWLDKIILSYIAADLKIVVFVERLVSISSMLPQTLGIPVSRYFFAGGDSDMLSFILKNEFYFIFVLCIVNMAVLVSVFSFLGGGWNVTVISIGFCSLMSAIAFINGLRLVLCKRDQTRSSYVKTAMTTKFMAISSLLLLFFIPDSLEFTLAVLILPRIFNFIYLRNIF